MLRLYVYCHFLSTLKRSDSLWAPPSLLSKEYLKYRWTLIPCSAEFRIGQSYKYTRPHASMVWWLINLKKGPYVYFCSKPQHLRQIFRKLHAHYTAILIIRIFCDWKFKFQFHNKNFMNICFTGSRIVTNEGTFGQRDMAKLTGFQIYVEVTPNRKLTWSNKSCGIRTCNVIRYVWFSYYRVTQSFTSQTKQFAVTEKGDRKTWKE